MNPRLTHFRGPVKIAGLLLIAAAMPALAANPPGAAPSREMREQMAMLHEQLAACLRSDKPVAECHQAMMKSCQDMMGKQGCAMMNGGMRGMHQKSQDSAPQQ